jgi:phosphomannomutase
MKISQQLTGLDFANEWVHLRKSNTEPIIRIYTQKRQHKNNTLALRIIDEIKAVGI